MATRLRRAASAWDRLAARDPGLLRSVSALRVVVGIALTLAVLGLSGAPAALLVAGCFAPFTVALAIGEGSARDQAFVVAAAVPLVPAVLLVGGALAPFPMAAEGGFVLLIFWAVYVRGYGPRGHALGIFAFMAYFLTQFLDAGVSDLPGLYAAVGVGFAADALVRSGLLRARQDGTLRRLRRAFRTQLRQVVLETIEVVRAGRVDARAIRSLERRVARLHRSALVIEDVLDRGGPGGIPGESRRIARVEVAAQRLAVLAVRSASALPAAPRAREQVVAWLEAVQGHLARTRDGRDVRGLEAAHDRGARRLDGAPTGLLDVHDSVRELIRALAGPRPVADGPVDRGPYRTVAGDAASRADGVSPGRGGLRPGMTWQAVQVAAAAAVAVVGADASSSEHWYWAVLSAWVVFVNTETSGAVLVQGLQRLLGTVLGVACGLAVAAAGGTASALVAGAGGVPVILCVSLVCVFGIFCTPPDAYWVVSFFITCMIVTLFVLLGVFSTGLLAVRVWETALGVLCGVLAAALVVPTTVHRAGGERLLEVLRALRRTRSPRGAAPLAARELDRSLEGLRRSLRPLTHPLNPRRVHRARVRQLLALLESCAYHARSLATAGSGPARPARLGGAVCADEAAERVRANLDEAIRLVQAGGRPAIGGHGGVRTLTRLAADPRWSRDHTSAGDRALFHLYRLDEATAELARALGGPAAGTRRARHRTAVSVGRSPCPPRPAAGSGR
ncbi:FUSC family protein [Actinomadura nitritigenes]|uniref:FUSC family protein n=1 Tax=Actinomadura nitritigenes TaxID=134602 RepID=UPI003D9329B5